MVNGYSIDTVGIVYNVSPGPDNCIYSILTLHGELVNAYVSDITCSTDYSISNQQRDLLLNGCTCAIACVRLSGEKEELTEEIQLKSLKLKSVENELATRESTMSDFRCRLASIS